MMDYYDQAFEAVQKNSIAIYERKNNNPLHVTFFEQDLSS